MLIKKSIYLYKNSRECYNKLKKKLPKFIKSFPIKKKNLITAINADKKNLKKICKYSSSN